MRNENTGQASSDFLAGLREPERSEMLDFSDVFPAITREFLAEHDSKRPRSRYTTFSSAPLPLHFRHFARHFRHFRHFAHRSHRGIPPITVPPITSIPPEVAPIAGHVLRRRASLDRSAVTTFR